MILFISGDTDSFATPRSLYSANYIEPIPSPEQRIETLKKPKENGIHFYMRSNPVIEYIRNIKFSK